VATEAAWLNGNNLEKEETNEAEREKKRKDERKVLTLTGLLMEGVEPPVWYKNILVRTIDEIHPQSGHLVRILPNNRFGATRYAQGDEHTVGAGGAL
jgi:hypothetical protein